MTAPSTTRPKRGACPVCLRRFRLRANGTIGWHAQRSGASCDGSYQPSARLTGLSAMTCWAWWYTMARRDGHHRCAEPEDHAGPHRCCCGAMTDVATHSVCQ